MNEKNYDIDRQELIRRLLEGEETAEDRAYVAEHPDVAAELEDIKRSRALIGGALDTFALPSGLADQIRAAQDGEEESKNNWFWIYSMVASIAITIGIMAVVGVFDGDGGGDPIIAETDTPVADPGLPIDTILQVGMTDHMRCAVANFSGAIPSESMDKMKMGIGAEFEMLVPIVGEGITLANLVVAHRCSFHGREYVHLVLKGEGDTLVSVAITERHEDEILQGRSNADSTVAGHDLFRRNINGFEIAGFQTEKYLVFVASNLSVEENLRAVAGIVAPVSELLEL